MIWLDYVLIIIIALSALYGFFRGFVREILSLIGWVVSFWIALKFSHKLTGVFDGMFSNEGLLYGVSFVALLLISLIAFAIAGMIISKFVKLTGLGIVDRGIGAAFGIGRGVLIVAALVFFGNKTPLVAAEAWNQSTLIGPFKEFAAWATDFRSNNANRILPPVEDHSN